MGAGAGKRRRAQAQISADTSSVVEILSPGCDPGALSPGCDPGALSPGYDPGALSPGYDPGALSPGYDPGALPEALGDAIVSFGASTIKDREGEVVVEWLRQPEVADGRCRLAAESFALLLAEQGLDAAAECQDDEEPPYGKAWGYDDRTQNSGWGNHWLTVARLHGQVYTIDFAAAQFGYSQFPLVQRLVDGEWRRL
jgi:hypothetical protein